MPTSWMAAASKMKYSRLPTSDSMASISISSLQLGLQTAASGSASSKEIARTR
jgi:hypothetical protein